MTQVNGLLDAFEYRFKFFEVLFQDSILISLSSTLLEYSMRSRKDIFLKIRIPGAIYNHDRQCRDWGYEMKQPKYL